MKILDHEIHPLCELFPFMDVKTFDALKTDMKAYGQRDTVKVFKDLVLDGKNRLKACRELSITPKIEVLPDDTDIIAYVKASGLCRRDLTPDQRIDIAEELLVYEREINGTKEKIQEIKDSKQGIIIEEKEVKTIADEANSTVKAVKEYRDIKILAKTETEAKEGLDKIKKGKATIQKIHTQLTKVEKPKPKRPQQPTKSEIKQSYLELNTNYKWLLEKHRELIGLLQQRDLWDELKTILYPIAETKKAPIYTIQQLRESGEI